MGKEEHKLVQYGGAAREGGIKCADCHEVFPSVYLAVLVDNNLKHFVYYPPGAAYTIPDCTDTFNGRKFVCWKWANDDGDFYYPGQKVVLDNNLQIDTVLVSVADTSYIDRDGAEKTVAAGVLNAASFPGCLSEGWYVLTESVDFNRQPFHISGDVKLILKDGVTVKINQEITGSDDASLTIYGQSAQTGKLECTKDVTLSSYRQYGGSFSSSGTVSVSDDIEITRGSFNADLLSCEYASTAKLLGGTVRLNALSFNGTIMELGWSNLQDSITLGKYLTISNHCTFKISDGQTMKKYYTGGESYTGTLTADHIAQIEDIKLVPYEQHHFGAPQWSWSDDYCSASAKFVCTDHSEEFTVEAEVTKVETPTQRYFKAECWFNGAVYSNEQVRDILRAITVQQNAHGTVTADKQTAAGGETVKLNAVPNSGWAFTTFTVTDAAGNHIPVTNNSFTMPTAAVTVSAEFINYTYVPAVEPYVGEDGAYVFGVKEHYKDSSGNKYLINADRSRGALCQNDSELRLSYFEADGNTLKKYTGPTDNLTELVIPKTYDGNKVRY